MDWSWCDAVWICTTDKNRKLEKFEKTLHTLEHDLGVPKKKIHVNSMKHALYNTHQLSVAANHLSVWKQAHNLGQKIIFIVEDDIILANNDLEIVNREITLFLQSGEKWDIFYLGGYVQTITPGIKRNTIRKCACWALHAYIVNDNFLRKYHLYTPEKLLSEGQILKSLAKRSDQHLQNCQKNMGIDGWLVLLSVHGHVDSFCIYPRVLDQSSYEPVENAIYNIIGEPFVSISGNFWSAIILLTMVILSMIMIFILVISYIYEKKHVKSARIQKNYNKINN